MTYWEQRRSQLMSQLEKDEEKLKQKLSAYYDQEAKKFEKEIASYYQLYGEDNVIEYRKLMLSLSDEDKALLIEDMNEFAEKYPQYQHLLPVRESVYKLNRLEGLQMSTRMQQLRLGAIDNMALENHLRKQAERSVDAIAKDLGFGEEFYSMNPNIVETVINQQWADGKNFSERIWNNREKLANYLNDDFAKGIARGDSYEKLMKTLRQRFDNVSRNDMYRLIYTEDTFVMNESMIKPFEEDFEEYEFSIADSRACGVCTALNGQKFRMQDRQPGINFPPMHAYCRCSFTIVIPDDFVEKYEQKYNRNAPKYETPDGTKFVFPDTSSSFTPAKSIEEAEKFALENGVRHVDYSDLPLETANLLNEAAMTLPKDIRPAFIGSAKGVQKVSGAKFSRKAKDYYGVHVDVLEMHFGEYPNIEHDFEGGNVVGISTAYKTPEKIHKSKVEGNKAYAEKHNGHTQFFNENGRSTAFHEMGHVYADKKGVPEGFAKDAERWLKESKCDMLKSTDEAWAEAWGAYHTKNPELPDYIAKYIEDATGSTLTKPPNSDIINSNIHFDGKIYKKKSSDFKTVYLDKNEYKHLMSEIATNLSAEQKASSVFIKYCGNYQYIVENHGFGNYRVISRRKIK